MNPNDKQFNSVDAFLGALGQDINATPPDDLDAETVAFLRDLVRAETIIPDESLQARVWQRALSNAQETSTFNPSLNGHKTDQTENEKERPMTVISYNDVHTRIHRKQLPLTLAVAAVITLLFAGLLFTFNNRPDNTSLLSTQEQDTPVPSVGEDVDIVALFERYINEVFVAGDMDVLDEIISPDHILHSDIETEVIEGFVNSQDLLSAYGDVVESITIEDYIANENSVWARLNLSYIYTPWDDAIEISGQTSNFTSSGMIVVYLDEDTGLFDETYTSLLSVSFMEASLSQIRLASDNTQSESDNLEIARTAFNTFWSFGRDFYNTDVNLTELRPLYTPDYRLYVNGDEVLQASEDLRVGEILDTLRANISMTNFRLRLTESSMRTSGSYVFAEFIAETEVNDVVETFTGNITYRFVDGLISEEWWTTERELLNMAVLESGPRNPYEDIYAENTDIVQSILTTYWQVDDYGLEPLDDEAFYALYAPDYQLNVSIAEDEQLWFPVTDDRSIQDVLASVRTDFELDNVTLTDITLTSSGNSISVMANAEVETNGVIETYDVFIIYSIDDGMVDHEIWSFFRSGYFSDSLMSPTEIEANIQIVQIILDTFWDGNWNENFDADSMDIAALYAPDYRLHNGDETLQATEDVPVGELLNTIRAEVFMANPNLSLSETSISISGNYVVVDIVAEFGDPAPTTQVSSDDLTFSGSFVYLIEDGLIVEEWWMGERGYLATPIIEPEPPE